MFLITNNSLTCGMKGLCLPSDDYVPVPVYKCSQKSSTASTPHFFVQGVLEARNGALYRNHQ